MNKTILTSLKILLFLAIGIGILWLLYHSLNEKFLEDCAQKGVPAASCSLIDKVWQDLKSAKVIWLVVITFCFFVSNISRALRWQQFTNSLGYHTRFLNSFHSTMLGYFANLGFPRIGEVIRAGTFSRYESIPFEKVIGTVALDRVLDLICFGLVFLMALTLQYDTLWTYISENASFDIVALLQSPWLIATLLLLVFGAIMVYLYREVIVRYRLVQKVYGLVIGFVDGLAAIRKVDNLPVLLLHTLIIWGMYYLMTFLCFQAFEPTATLGPLAGLMVFVFGSLGMIIPSPGGMGSYHALVIAALALYGVNVNDAFSFAMIIFFTINIFGNILFGILALIHLPGYNQSYQPVRA